MTWGLYQRIVAAYRDPDLESGKRGLQAVIASLTHGVPEELTELATLGRTLGRRAADVLAFFDHPGSSNGPTEAINGRLEHLRGTALGVFGTWTTTLLDRFWTPVGSGQHYTLKCEEPGMSALSLLYQVSSRRFLDATQSPIISRASL